MEHDDDHITARREADRAAEQAGSIGGEGSDPGVDPADQPVAEGGGGEAEGFEQAEALHRENAEHGDGRGEPMSDAMPDEPEAGATGAAYGEPDTVESTQAEDRQAERDAELDESPPPHDH